MHLPKAIASTLAFLVVTTLVQAIPIPSPVDLEASEIMEVDKRALEFNDWNCKPSAKHPRPVVLVHGLSANAWDNWLYIRPRLALKGYCSFALSYGQLNHVPVIYGLDKMENSAQQLSDFVDKGELTPWARTVDILGHSQGSIMPRYYFKFLGGAAKVNKFAAIGSIQYGSTLLGLVPFLTGLGLYDPIKKVVDVACLSCFQFLWDSPFIRNLNAGGDTIPGIEYLMITSMLEETVTPYTSGFLRDKNPLVHNAGKDHILLSLFNA
ncbi:hypothetical protein BGZ93_004922 [Podila epicladia]|nr:hypothetical protein BGZ93_004922 [Podila epicladia]